MAFSAFTYINFSDNKTETYFHVTVFFALNGTMIYAVIMMRYVIQKAPELFPNEKMIVVHVSISTIVSLLWAVARLYRVHYNH